MDLKNLYQEVILDHNRNPHNYGAIENADASAKGYNPLCGDKITLSLSVSEDKIQDAKFEGCGCAISTASASLMTDYLKGKSFSEAHDMFELFHNAITKNDVEAEKALGKLSVLTGVKEFPARVKCATLAWHTLEAALEQNEQMVSTE